jgi:hypothetical protein
MSKITIFQTPSVFGASLSKRLFPSGVILANFLFSFFKIPYNRQTLWYLVLILFFSGMVAVRASEFLLFWNIAITYGLLLIFAAHHGGKNIKNYIKCKKCEPRYKVRIANKKTNDSLRKVKCGPTVCTDFK